MPSPDSPGQRLLAFASALPGTDYLYLLLDPLAAYPAQGPLAERNLNQALGAARIYRVPRQALAHSPAHQPRLCQLAGPGLRLAEAQLQASVARACAERATSQRYVCGWLHSLAPIAEVARHVARQAASLPEAGGSALPWYEPLRLELLASNLEGGLGAVLGPVQGWWAPTSWGTFAQWAGAGMATAGQCAHAERAQAQVPLIKRLLGLWHSSAALPPQAASTALEMIVHARTLGLHDGNDILTLCLYRACTHAMLHLHPQIQLHIDEAARGLSPLPTAFSRYSDGQWQQMIAELGER